MWGSRDMCNGCLQQNLFTNSFANTRVMFTLNQALEVVVNFFHLLPGLL